MLGPMFPLWAALFCCFGFPAVFGNLVLHVLNRLCIDVVCSSRRVRCAAERSQPQLFLHPLNNTSFFIFLFAERVLKGSVGP